MALIDPGKKAPAFTLADQNGETHKLASYAGRPVILYFYPKDDHARLHPGNLRVPGGAARLKKSKAVVLGVSILDEKSKAKFAKKHGVTFPAARRRGSRGGREYGVWQEKARYGRKYMGHRAHDVSDRRRGQGGESGGTR
jgi:peroxiredoxin Q/BCP